jgi:hypothetical protein
VPAIVQLARHADGRVVVKDLRDGCLHMRHGTGYNTVKRIAGGHVAFADCDRDLNHIG